MIKYSRQFMVSMAIAIMLPACSYTPETHRRNSEIFDTKDNKRWTKTREGCLFRAEEKPWILGKRVPTEDGSRRYSMNFDWFVDNTSWSGDCEDGFATGYGVFSIVPRSQHGPYQFGVYIGHAEHGVPSGFGSYVYQYGEKYHGNWVAGKRSGIGTYETAFYKCNRDSGKREYSNEGYYKYDVFHGAWIDGEPSEGLCFFKNGAAEHSVKCAWKKKHKFTRDGLRPISDWNPCDPEKFWTFK